MKMLRFLAVVMVVCFGVPAVADTVSLTWQPPATRTDGTAITAEEIAGYHLMVDGKLIMENTVLGDVPVLLSDGTNTLSYETDPGEICMTLSTVDTEGRESAFTPEKCKTAKGPPGQPIILEMTIIFKELAP